MPIGKNSIQRASKTGAAVKAEPEKTVVAEHVIANISPEVVEKVLPKKGKKKADKNDGKVSLNQPLPYYLL